MNKETKNKQCTSGSDCKTDIERHKEREACTEWPCCCSLLLCLLPSVEALHSHKLIRELLEHNNIRTADQSVCPLSCWMWNGWQYILHPPTQPTTRHPNRFYTHCNLQPNCGGLNECVSDTYITHIEDILTFLDFTTLGLQLPEWTRKKKKKTCFLHAWNFSRRHPRQPTVE